MFHRGGDRARGADFNAHRVAQSPVGELGDLRGQGGGEKERLPVLRALGDDALHRGQESDVEHPVDFIEDENLDVAQFDRALLQVVFQTPRGGYNDIKAVAQSSALGSIADTPEDRSDPQVGEAC